MENLKMKSPRLLSLDIFRGGTVALMILVNNAGDSKHKYSQLNHSAWDGFTLTDLVFPCFLFMVGVSIVFAMERKKWEGGHGKTILGAFKRMVLLMLISWAILLFLKHQVPDDTLTVTAKISYLLSNLRIPGVLQRIGIVYFLTTLMYLKTTTKSQNILLVAVLLGYFILLCFVPAPGIGYPSTEAATNWGAWLDRAVLGTNHLYKIQWDPEGILSTLPSIATCLIGVRAGEWLKRNDVTPGDKVSWLFIYGVAAVVLALFWHIFFPINKKLWSSSFVLLTGGIALCILAFTYWLVDVKGRQRFTWPLVVFGMNALAAYIVSDLIRALVNMIQVGGTGALVFIQTKLIAPCFASPYMASLAGSVVIVLLCWVPMCYFYLKKIYIKV